MSDKHNPKKHQHVHGSFANWHASCNVSAVSGTGGIGVKLVCLDCGCISDAEAIMDWQSEVEAETISRKREKARKERGTI